MAALPLFFVMLALHVSFEVTLFAKSPSAFVAVVTFPAFPAFLAFRVSPLRLDLFVWLLFVWPLLVRHLVRGVSLLLVRSLLVGYILDGCALIRCPLVGYLPPKWQIGWQSEEI